MEIEALRLIVPDLPQTSIQSAIDDAADSPFGMVWIPANYSGHDSFTNALPVPVFDMRSGGTMAVGKAMFGKGSPWIDVTHPKYGAVGDGVTDSTAAIQSAFNAATVLSQSFGGAGSPVIYFPPGLYVLSSPVTKGSGLVLGAFEMGTVFTWHGAVGATMFTQSTDPGGSSLGGWVGVRFGTGPGNDPARVKPATFLSLGNSPAGMDAQYRIEHCMFNGCTGDALVLPKGYTNAQFRQVRFDDVSGYDIAVTLQGGETDQRFLLEEWTSDNGGSSSKPGFLHFDNTANAGNLGVIKISTARVELNAALAGPKSFVTLTSPTAAPNPRWAQLNFENIDFQDVVAQAGLSLVYSNSTAASFDPATIVMQNCKLPGSSQMALQGSAGSWVGPTIPGETSGLYLLRGYGDQSGNTANSVWFSNGGNSFSDSVVQTWVPTFTGLTETGGAATKVARFVKFGKQVFFHVSITPVTSTSSVAGTTFFTTPTQPSFRAACYAADDNVASLGNGVVLTGVGGRVFTPTWTNDAGVVVISGSYFE